MNDEIIARLQYLFNDSFALERWLETPNKGYDNRITAATPRRGRNRTDSSDARSVGGGLVFVSWPNPRFRTLEDAKKYIETGDTRLCITVYLAEDTPNGRMVRVNPGLSRRSL